MKHTPLRRLPTLRGSTRGFSLVELLSVMGIILVLLGTGVSITNSAFRGTEFRSGVARLTGILDQARQHAIANNTYVWVAMTDVPAGPDSAEPGLRVAVVESTDGTNAAGWSGTVDLADDRFRLINRLEWLAGTELGDPSTAAALPTAMQPKHQGEEPANQLSFRVPDVGGRSSTLLDQTVVFSPRGEAVVGPSPVAFADIPLRRAHSGQQNAVALIQLSGLTGTLRVYR